MFHTKVKAHILLWLGRFKIILFPAASSIWNPIMLRSPTAVLKDARQMGFCLRAFALVVPYAWNALPPDTMAHFLSLPKPLLITALSLAVFSDHSIYNGTPSIPLSYFILLHTTPYYLMCFIYTVLNFFTGCSTSPLCKIHESRDISLFIAVSPVFKRVPGIQ